MLKWVQKRRHKIVATACAIFVFWLVVSSHSFFQECIQAQQNAETEKSFYESVSNFLIAGGVLRGCTGHFIHENGDAITALATVFLAVITYMLVMLGKEQGETTRAQLRAYVFAVEGDIDNVRAQSGKAVRATLRVENTGQTPAYEVLASAYWRYECGAIVKDFRDDTLENQKLTIAPRAHIPVIAYAKDSAIPAKPTDGIQPKFFVIARIDYLDVFGRPQWTNFRCEVRRDGSTGQDHLHPCPDGNDAT